MTSPEFNKNPFQVKKNRFDARDAAVSFSPSWVREVLDAAEKIKAKHSDLHDDSGSNAVEESLDIKCSSEIQGYDDAKRFVHKWEIIFMQAGTDGVHVPPSSLDLYVPSP